MIASLLSAMTTFFATIGPIEAAVLFATLTPKMERVVQRAIAVRATLIAGSILGVFTILGQPLLRQLGVTIPALQTAGGIILMLIAIEMIFAKPGSVFRLTPSEGAEAQSKEDIAVFPLATPMLAGPGAMSSGILLAANAHGDPLTLAMVVVALMAVMAITLALLLAAHDLNRLLGVTAQRVLMRVFGILLSGIAVQAIFTGIVAEVRDLNLPGLAGLP